MRDQRVGVISIEASEGGYTVGLCFLNDLLYLLRLPDYHQYFCRPVMDFLQILNDYEDSVFDEDGKDSEEAYK